MSCNMIFMFLCRRGSPLLMGVRSDHKLSADHIPVLYRSCNHPRLFLVWMIKVLCEGLDLIVLFLQPGKRKRAAAPCPGPTRTPACSHWMRKLWSTTLHLMQGKKINVAASAFVVTPFYPKTPKQNPATPVALISKLMYKVRPPNHNVILL